MSLLNRVTQRLTRDLFILLLLAILGLIIYYILNRPALPPAEAFQPKLKAAEDNLLRLWQHFAPYMENVTEKIRRLNEIGGRRL